MIIHDKKKVAGLIISKMGENGREKSQEVKPEEEMNDKDGALKAICEDIMQAVSDKSAHDLMNALKAFLSEQELQGEQEE